VVSTQSTWDAMHQNLMAEASLAFWASLYY